MPNKNKKNEETSVQWVTYLQPDQSECLLEDMQAEIERLKEEFGPEYDRTKSKHLAYVVNSHLKWVVAGKPDWEKQEEKLKELRKEARELRKELRELRKVAK